MLKAIIIDDELDSIEALTHDLKAFKNINVVATCQSAKEGRKAIKAWEPDVVFLDISMPYENGFELLESIAPIDFEVIFVTAYDEHAVKAFKNSAVHYLLKPISEEELEEAVKRVEKRRQHLLGFSPEQLEILLENNASKTTNTRFAIPTMQGYAFCLLESILYCLADGNSTKIVTTGKNYVSGHNLKTFEERLPKAHFCRIHQSHIINMQHVIEYFKGKSAYVLMQDKKGLGVSEARKKPFENRFKW